MLTISEHCCITIHVHYMNDTNSTNHIIRYLRDLIGNHIYPTDSSNYIELLRQLTDLLHYSLEL